MNDEYSSRLYTHLTLVSSPALSAPRTAAFTAVEPHSRFGVKLRGVRVNLSPKRGYGSIRVGAFTYTRRGRPVAGEIY